MNCPCCNDPMLVLELEQVEVDYCESCGGIWLDSGELELLMENSSEKDRIFRSFQVDKENRETRRKCPICLKKMDKVFCGEAKNVLLDKCPNGHGIWFDEGELHDIVCMGGIDKDNRVVGMLKSMMENRLKTQEK